MNFFTTIKGSVCNFCSRRVVVGQGRTRHQVHIVILALLVFADAAALTGPVLTCIGRCTAATERISRTTGQR